MPTTMTADEALIGMREKLAAKGLPPGILQAILEAVIGLFKSFCPTMSPGPAELRAVSGDGLAAFESDKPTKARIHLRRALRRHLGFFSRHLDDAERALWTIGTETSDDELVQYTAVWQVERETLADGD